MSEPLGIAAGFQKKIVITRSYQCAYPDPLKLQQGDLVRIEARESEWKGWSWAVNGAGRAGWVPDSYLERKGASSCVLKQEYDATELTVEEGQTLWVGREESGWFWCRTDRGDEGWVPAKHARVEAGIPEIRTARLMLRGWREADREPFAAMSADPRVMELLLKPLSRAESDDYVDRIGAHFVKHGFGLWAVEVPGVAPFIGFTGLWVPTFEAAFTPCVEIGWRLAAEFWGRGYASEAARAILIDGFGRCGLREIVAMTTPPNRRSIRVMEKIGMHRNPADDFDHPRVAEGHPLRRHVLYRLAQETWSRQSQ